MASRAHELLFEIKGALDSSFSGSFSTAETELQRVTNALRETSSTVGDIAAYEKHSAAVQASADKIANLTSRIDVNRERLTAATASQAQYSTELEKAKGQLSDAQTKYSQLGVELQTLEAQQKAAGGSSAELAARIAETKQEHQQAGEEVQRLASRVDELTDRERQAGNEVAQWTTQISKQEEQLQRANDAMGRSQEKADQYAKSIEKAGYSTGDLDGATEELRGTFEGLKGEQEAAAENMSLFGQRTTAAVDALQQFAVAAGVSKVVAALTDALGECIQASISFESTMAGVQRTVGGTTEQLAEMSSEFKALSTEIPITTESLGTVATTAGQLGIAQENVTEFTEVMAMLGTTTDVTAESAATLLAQFSNITGMDPSDYDRLGATVAQLGDSTATTASKVVEMSQGMAAAASIAGMGETDILAISAAVGSLGIESQAGSTAMSTLIQTLYKAVETGNRLEEFASVANMTAEEFAVAWGQDAVGALDAFISGLNDTERNGQSAVVILEELGITNVRQTKAILGLANAEGLLSGTIETANSAWEENTALQEKANIMYGTTEAKIQMLENSTTLLSQAFGDALTPAIGVAAEALTPIVTGMAGVVEQNAAVVQGLTVAVGVLAAATAGTVALAAGMKALKLAFAALPGAKTFLAVSAAVAAVAGVATMAASSYAKMKEESEVLTLESQRLQEEIEALTLEYERVCEASGETSDEALALQGKIKDLSKEFDATKQTAGELAAEIRSLSESVTTSMEEYASAIDETYSELADTLALTALLEELANKTQLTAGEQAVMGEIVDQLNSQYSDLGLTFDSTTNSMNMSVEAINAVARAEAEAAVQAIKLQSLIDYEQKLAVAEAKLQEATENASVAREEYNGYMEASMEKADKSRSSLSYLFSEIGRAVSGSGAEMAVASEALQDYEEGVEDAQEAVDELTEEMEQLKAEIDVGAESAKQAAEATEEYASALEALAAVSDVVAEALNEAYASTLASAEASLNGQISLTQKFEKATEVSLETIIGNMNSYGEAYTNYYENLMLALENGLDPSAVTHYFTEVTAETAMQLAVLADSGVDGIEAFNESFQQNFGSSSELASVLAIFSEDFVSTIDEMMEEAGVTAEEGAEEMVSAIIAAFLEGEGEITAAEIEAIVGGLSEATEAGTEAGYNSGRAIIEAASEGAQSAEEPFKSTLRKGMENSLFLASRATEGESRSAGAHAVDSMAEGAESRTPFLGQANTDVISDSLETAETATVAEAEAVGASEIEAMAAGVEAEEQTLTSSLDSTISSSLSSAQSSTASQALSVGKALVQGIAQGASSNSGILASAMRSVIQVGLDAAKAEAGISSPSRLFDQEVGVYIPGGAAQGVERGTPAFAEATTAMINAGMDAAARATQKSTPDMTLVGLSPAIFQFGGGTKADADISLYTQESPSIFDLAPHIFGTAGREGAPSQVATSTVMSTTHESGGAIFHVENHYHITGGNAESVQKQIESTHDEFFERAEAWWSNKQEDERRRRFG